MNPKYTAILYIESGDGEFLESSGNNLEQLLEWMNKAAKESLANAKGEVFNHREQRIVERIEYHFSEPTTTS
jgi:hypothetical protein